MNKSDSISALATALVLAQPSIETAKMDSVNPFFKSKYADLGAVWDAVREALKANGLTVAQFPDHIDGAPCLTTMLIHKSGEWISGTYPLVVADKEKTSQGYGSALTYARRYGLSAVLGVIADTDDDGNAASRPKPAAPPKSADAPSQKTESPVPDPAGQVVIIPEKWCQMGIDRVKIMDRKALDAFEEKYHQKIAQVRLVAPKEHALLIAALRQRHEALA